MFGYVTLINNITFFGTTANKNTIIMVLEINKFVFV